MSKGVMGVFAWGVYAFVSLIQGMSVSVCGVW